MSYAKFIEEDARDRLKLHDEIEKLISAYEEKYVGMTISEIKLWRKAYNWPGIDTQIKLPEYL
jgi:hypothetical protein